MKKRTLIAVLIIGILFVATTLWAAELNNIRSSGVDGDLVFYNKDGTEIARFDDSAAAFNITTLTHSRERSFGLPLMGFILSDSSPVTATTAPGIEVDDSIPNIVWADGEVTPVMITFRIPSDYSSGGAFRLICTESNSTTPNQVDFDVFVNRDGVAVDSSGNDQTPVALAGTTSTPDVVTLTPATDFAALAAGDWVTLRIWRDNVATGTGDLEVKGVEFFYTASN
jgi:hypothetical protein